MKKMHNNFFHELKATKWGVRTTTSKTIIVIILYSKTTVNIKSHKKKVDKGFIHLVDPTYDLEFWT